MRISDWKSRQSLALLLASALILPAIIAFAVGFSSTQNERRRIEEREALMTAREIIDLSDSQTLADLRALQMIGNSQVMARRGWTEVGYFFAVAQRANPHWRALLVRDAQTGELLFEQGKRSEAPAKPLPTELRQHDEVVEGAFREGRYCPCVVVHQIAAADRSMVLSIYISPQSYQAMLAGRVKPGNIAAIVDRKGHFVARSLNYRERVGGPATIYVRRAIERGGRGLYRGRTYEGLENYSAYVTSTLTGWSGHVAVDRSQIDGPRSRSIMAIAIALAAGLVLAVALIVYALKDMQARSKSERQLLELQKAEAIGQFVSIVVHDIRNILAVLWAGLDRIRRPGADAQAARTLAAMEDALKRGERLVNQMLSFARGDRASAASVDLQALLEEIEVLLGRTLGDGIALNWSVDPAARYVLVNGDQLELALLNLARNAKQAMQDKGVFAIAARLCGDWVELSICDTGPGVPADVRDRVFEPFFTTKAGAEGTGLGLAQVAGAVRQAGGEVELRDRPGGGAEFLLRLRAASPPMSAAGSV